MFEADDHGSDADCRELKYTCPARDTLVLKEGAMVILLRNLSAGERASSARAQCRAPYDTLPAADGLVNGRTGIIKHIEVSKHSGK
jgi:hypothetical protein